MSIVITIDGGTTNTRVYLWENGNLADQKRRDVGVRNTAIDGDNRKLKNAVKEMLAELLSSNNLTFRDVEAIYASGMLTSNVGLYELPHLIAPAGIVDFADGVREVLMEDIAPVPISFIPGLKNMKNEDVSLSNVGEMDIMRGEETEAVAILSEYPDLRNAVLILPGSHTKFVIVDNERRIAGCLTSMTGELLSMVTENSVIADSVGKDYLRTEPDWEYLYEGYCQAKNTGSFGRAAFITRILGQAVTSDRRCLQSFLLGAVLESDIAAVTGSRLIRESNCARVLIAGKETLSLALTYLIDRSGSFEKAECYQSASSELPLSGKGAIAIYKLQRGKGL